MQRQSKTPPDNPRPLHRQQSRRLRGGVHKPERTTKQYMKQDKDYPREHLDQQTALVVAAMVKAGAEQITPAELMNRTAAIGYKISKDCSFNYVNNANEVTYRARSIGWTHIASGMSFAHVDAPKETLPALQTLRFHCFVVHRGRIWEL